MKKYIKFLSLKEIIFGTYIRTSCKFPKKAPKYSIKKSKKSKKINITVKSTQIDYSRKVD